MWVQIRDRIKCIANKLILTSLKNIKTLEWKRVAELKH